MRSRHRNSGKGGLWGRIARAGRLLFVLAGAAAAAGALLFLWHAPAFRGGERYTLYFGETSSARMLTFEGDALPLLLPSGVRGESVLYAGDCAEKLLFAYGARVLFTERTGETVSYYCRSPLLGEGILLNGERVNLHIAAGGGQTAAGTPLIFGGF